MTCSQRGRVSRCVGRCAVWWATWDEPKVNPRSRASPIIGRSRNIYGTHLCAADRGTRSDDASLVNSQRDPVCAAQHVEVSATHAPTHSAHRRHGERRVVRGVAMAPGSRARAARTVERVQAPMATHHFQLSLQDLVRRGVRNSVRHAANTCKPPRTRGLRPLARAGEARPARVSLLTEL